MTPTTVGWILADGNDVDGTPLAHAEYAVCTRDGVDAVNASEQAAGLVLRVQDMVHAQGQRLHGIGVTWSDDAAAEAALLVESLTEAGFDNVVPVRFHQAAESLADGLTWPSCAEQAAVCIIEPALATVVLPDGQDGAPVVSQRVTDHDEHGDVADWLTALFEPVVHRPEMLVVAGSGTGLDALAERIQSGLSLPVVAQTEPQVALARGAALALEPRTELAGATDAIDVVDAAEVVRAALDEASASDRGRLQSLSYVGALTMLVVGAVSFVVSLSLALSPQAAPAKEAKELRPVHQVAKAPVVRPVVRPAAPVPAAPPEVVPEIPADAPEPSTVAEPSDEGVPAGEGAINPAEPEPVP